MYVGLGKYQRFLAVSLKVNSNRSKITILGSQSVSLVNGIYRFFILPLANNLNFFNDVTGKFSAIVNGSNYYGLLHY